MATMATAAWWDVGRVIAILQVQRALGVMQLASVDANLVWMDSGVIGVWQDTTDYHQKDAEVCMAN